MSTRRRCARVRSAIRPAARQNSEDDHDHRNWRSASRARQRSHEARAEKVRAVWPDPAQDSTTKWLLLSFCLVLAVGWVWSRRHRHRFRAILRIVFALSILAAIIPALLYGSVVLLCATRPTNQVTTALRSLAGENICNDYRSFLQEKVRSDSITSVFSNNTGEPSTTSSGAVNICVFDYIPKLKETYDSYVPKLQDGVRSLRGIARESPSTIFEPETFEVKAREVQSLIAIMKRKNLGLYFDSSVLQEELSSGLNRFMRDAKAVLDRPPLLGDWVKDYSFGFWKHSRKDRLSKSFDSWVREKFEEIARYRETVSELRQITVRLPSETPDVLEFVNEETENLRSDSGKTLRLRDELIQSLQAVPLSLEYLDRISVGLDEVLARLKTEIELADTDPLLRTCRPAQDIAAASAGLKILVSPEP